MNTLALNSTTKHSAKMHTRKINVVETEEVLF